MTFHTVEPFGTLTWPAINTEGLTKLIRSNISCHMNKPLTQDLIDTLTYQIIESIGYFSNSKEDIL